jgi:hypothetical protein
MLELAHAWWQTKRALDKARWDIEDLPHRIARERAQFGTGGRYAYLRPQNVAAYQSDLQNTKELVPQLEKQLADLEQQYSHAGYDETPYTAWTRDETRISGKGIEDVGRAVAKSGEPAGLQRTGDEFELISAVLAAPAILRLGKSLLGRVGVGLERRLTRDAMELRPYGRVGGGHHIPAKRAFEGIPVYDTKAALAVPRDEMLRRGIKHTDITGAQQVLYREFAKTGKELSWKVLERIETEALIRAGLDPRIAQATVKKAIFALKRKGVPVPSRIPWGNKS